MDDEENVEAGGAVASPAPAGNKKMMGLIVALLIVLIGVVVAVAIFVIGALNNGSDAGVTTLPAIDRGAEYITHVQLGSHISTNLLTGPDGREFNVLLNFTIGVNNTADNSDEILSLVQSSESIIRHTALNVIRDMTGAEVNARGGDIIIANEILRRLQEEFRTNLITDIFIVDLMTM